MHHAIHGAMRAFIVTGDTMEATAVVVQVGDAEPWCFSPFDKQPVTDIRALNERVLLVISDYRNESKYQMAAFDVVTRTQLGSVFDRHISRHARLIIDRTGRQLTLASYTHSFKAWSLPDLTPLWSKPLPAMNIVDVVERPDGMLLVKGADEYEYDSDAGKPVLQVVSPDGDVVESYGQATAVEDKVKGAYDPRRKYRNSPLKLSPHGRWLWRPHMDSILATTATGEPLDLARLKATPDSRLIEALKSVRVMGVQELWRAGPIEFVSRITVSEQSLFGMGDPMRLANGKPIKREAGLEAARLRLTWLIRMIELSPYDAWRPGQPSLSSMIGEEEAMFANLFWFGPQAERNGKIVEWCADDKRFVVAFKESEREGSIDGALGPVRSTPERESPWQMPPPGLSSLAKAFLRGAEPTFKLAGMTEAACIRAIGAVTASVAADLDALILGRRMTLRFKMRGRELSEKEFFAFVAAHCPGAAPALRSLLATYYAAYNGPDLWADDEAAALGYAVLSLAKIDPQAHQSLEPYFLRREPSHEELGTEQVLPALADRTGDFADPEALRFALRRLWEEEVPHQERGYLLAPRILRGAQAIYSPGEFVEEVRRAARERMLSEQVEKWAFTDRKQLLLTVLEMARDQEESATRGIVEPLLAAAQAGDDWERRFFTLMRRVKVRYPHSASRWLAGWRQANKIRAEARAKLRIGSVR